MRLPMLVFRASALEKHNQGVPVTQPGLSNLEMKQMSPKDTATRLPSDDTKSIRHLTKEEFGKRLYTLMREKGWNQSQLAKYAGMGRDNVSQYIRARSFPTPENASKLATALGVKPEELLPNYYESALERESPETEYRSIPNDPDHVWLRINRRCKKSVALKILGMIED